MVTGACQANAGLLIVDVEKGVQEQTKRHAYILKLLGINQLIVVINKMDLVNFSKKKYEKVKKEVLKYLKEIGTTPNFIIPVSAYYGDGVTKNSERIPWYKAETVIDALDALKEPFKTYDFRLPIQDIYKLSNKRIYVGNILSGMVKVGENVKIFPSGEEAKIEQIITFEGKMKEAEKPKAIGVTLNKQGFLRGNVITKGKKPIVTNEIEPTVFCLLNEVKEKEQYIFRCVTQETKCKIERVVEKIDVNTLEKIKNTTALKETEVGKVKIHLNKPVVVEKFENLPELGRFILEKNGEIVAGGIIT